MTAYLDTSVLVSAFWADHEYHERSAQVVKVHSPYLAACSAHSIAEFYAVTTRLPIKPRVRPEQAMLFLEELQARLAIVSLDSTEYIDTLRELSDRGIAGGRTYDALHLRCARKAESTTIYTWNVKDFQSVAPDLADRIMTP